MPLRPSERQISRNAQGDERASPRPSLRNEEWGSDAELLKTIHQNQDRQAFEELYQRHKEASFGLALHLVGNAPQARKVMEAAWLQIWQATRVKSPPVPVRKWILKKVVENSNS